MKFRERLKKNGRIKNMVEDCKVYKITDIIRIHNLMDSVLTYYTEDDMPTERFKKMMILYCLDIIEWLQDFEGI